MLDTQSDPQPADPPDDQPGKTASTTSTGTTPTADPPDDQPGGTT